MNRYIGILPLVAVIILASCSGKDEKNAAKDKGETVPVVNAMTVTSRVVDQIGTYTATVEPEIINNISANMANRIKQIYVDEGQRVSAGQRVAVLDDVNTFSYETQVNNARANLNNVQLDYDRAVELLRIGGGTKQQVDAMHTQLVNAKNVLAQAERALRNARENTVLTSPISGVVTARNYDPGDMTGNLPILTIARIQPVKIVINVTESELPKIRRGMAADIRFDTYGDEVFRGVVSTVMPTIDTQSRTFGVEITLPNANSKILPGMFGRVTLNLGKANRVVVPDKAVVKQQGSGNKYVYVYNSDGTVSYNLVELGQRLGDEYELISGVESGAKVIVNGQSKLADGKKVKLAK
ncbi:MAG: efflux RND transporter periplasmic adaptor subunit [Candidatus Amulumruptor caecigallinarius]|nr:efflux RND transporter periplasmic adaptor subunit [Candidatus Amulumruptor caecigallinarius]